MKQTKPRILTYILIGMAVLAALIVIFINRSLASLADWVYPGAALWTHLALLGVEFLAFIWFWRGLFGRHKHLLVLDNPSEEERLRFATELTRRMRHNPIIRKENLDPDDPDYLEQCLLLLGLKADQEIRRTAKRIFLSTALSQNGRIDALIVFVTLCRLVWRVSAIYNQRPHPREVISLYWAVVTSTFLALSLEELNVSTEIAVGFGEAFQSMAPAAVTSSIPFAGNALKTFTSSAIDGAANCYLALRTGIITRNAYTYGALQGGRRDRAAIYKEAGAILLNMSSSLMEQLAGTVKDKFADLARSAGDKTVQLGKNIVGGITGSAGKLASGTVSAVQQTGSGIARITTATGSGIGRAASRTGRTLSAPFRRKKKKDK